MRFLLDLTNLISFSLSPASPAHWPGVPEMTIKALNQQIEGYEKSSRQTTEPGGGHQPPEGEALEGEALEAEALEGDALEGEALEGEALDGEGLEGEALEGEALEGESKADSFGAEEEKRERVSADAEDKR